MRSSPAGRATARSSRRRSIPTCSRRSTRSSPPRPSSPTWHRSSPRSAPARHSSPAVVGSRESVRVFWQACSSPSTCRSGSTTCSSSRESFAVSAVCLLLLLLVEARRGERSWPWWCAGLVAGLLALLRENMLLVVPFLLPLVWRHDLSRRTVASRALRLLVGFALPLFPVLLHNGILAKRSGAFLPTTSQGGVNFWIGNNPQADGTYRPLVPGKQIPAYEQAEAGVSPSRPRKGLTPAEVSGYWLRRALAWAKAEPLAFARLQLRKVGLYWSRYEWPDAVDYYWMKSISPPLRLPGLEFFPAALLALAGLFFVRRELALWSPVLLFELGWMVTTVAFFLFSRYRLPAVPGLLLLAAVAIERTARLWRSERRGATLVATAAITVVWSIPHLAPFPPRRDLVEFNLGRLAEERGDRAAATAHYERALAADPRNLLALLNLGTLAARSGDLATALPRFETAVAVAPDSDDAWANLGATCLAGGDLDGARRALNRALELNPENRFALHNRALLEKRSAPPG
ncbi:MAG: tetratricopeptide repeat protein [Thermoanaerobaculia bacterium]